MKVLVIAPHPDDETLGCGGTLLRQNREGDEIHWLIMTEMQNPEYNNCRILSRLRELDLVKQAYSFESMTIAPYKTTQLDQVPTGELVGQVARTLDIIKPNIVYLPYRFDPHSDHRITFEAAWACLKTFRAPYVSRVYMYETISETEFTSGPAFTPNMFVNITDYYNEKTDIMLKYNGEIGEHPFPRSFKNLNALATFRGAAIGYRYAEAFMLLKERML
jgi:LmbE family N-acetylglucosaminyl deacetylase